MRLQHMLAGVALAALLGTSIVPALAASSGAPDATQTQGMGRTGHGMMSRGMMGGGCASMMQSMKGEDGRPNSRWQKLPPADRSTPD